MNEIYPGIFLITEKGISGVVKPPANIYVIAGNDGLIYDAGYGNRRIVKYAVNRIKEIKKNFLSRNKPFNITRILPSHAHPDHFAGVKLLRDSLGVKIILTRKTAEIIKNKQNYSDFFEAGEQQDLLYIRNCRRKLKDKVQTILWQAFYKRTYGLAFIDDADEIIEENSEILINDEKWKIFSSPGHSPDHISLYNKEKGILFSGDNVLRSITTWLGPPHCDIEEYVDSIKLIQSLPGLKIILPAHGSPVENPYERLQEIVEHRELRKNQVLDTVKQNALNGISPGEIVEKLYPGAGKIMKNTARGWICLTLLKLEEENLVVRQYTKKKILFYPSTRSR